MEMLLNVMHRFSITDLSRRLRPDALTVLNYHRVENPHAAAVTTYRPNISASPDQFEEQMTYLADRYHVISAQEFSAWLAGRTRLPRHAALITFDDGYRDNLTQAFPILQRHDFPALIFLSTDFIDHGKVFYWDFIAWCFSMTQLDEAVFPLIGKRTWADPFGREAVIDEWIRALKKIDDSEKNAMVAELPKILGLPEEGRLPAERMALTWDEVRELYAAGISFGAHTVTHPILTRIPNEQVHAELRMAKRRIEDELSTSVSSFAYPNGGAADFDFNIQKAVREAGYLSAFTLLDGPSAPAEVQADPFAIRRIFIGHQDNISRFSAKLAGIPRLLKSIVRG